MGRPRELSDEERRRLLAEGYEPVEMWVLDTKNSKVLEEIRQEARLIAEADRREGIDAALEAFAADILARERDYEW